MAPFSRNQPSATLLIHELTDPRGKGIVEVKEEDANSYQVLSVQEKPEKPKTKLAIEPVHIFQPEFFEDLAETKPGDRGEIQITDAMERMIREGMQVLATGLLEDEIRLNVGDSESYWQALSASHRLIPMRGI